ncbi:porin [Hyphomicrobium sp. CS1GBMeth3]|uniref:porin n=1 Tax=Hyphomicrobium sp. CS1GBMeth3 TaxID=1892845 RepID=UPI0009FA7080|nr:porin [Hyphomicrobium sp. CS1GBMeth3]
MTAGRLSLLAAAGLLLVGGTSAQAADLGGDCCADLEERIAELEATTARKGNRKVKLEVSGQVNEAVIFWDDGFEDNVGVYTNDASRTRFRFKGDAKINDEWKAGYLLEVGVRGANSKRFNQDNPTGGPDNTGLDLRHSTWYIDSKRLGRVWIGLTGGAGESITEINVAGTGDVAKYSDAEDLGGDLALRRSNGDFSNGPTLGTGAISIRRLIRAGTGNQPGEGRRYNMVRYDTPEIFGFVGTANWGADDTWEVGLRYKGEFAGFKMAAGIAYGEATEQTGTGHTVGFECATGSTLPGGRQPECHQFGGSISVMHEATGLYTNFAAGIMTDDRIREIIANAEEDHKFWAIEVGIQQKWIPLGKTTVFGQYYNNDGGTFSSSSATFGGANPADRVLNSELDIYSLGIMQGIDAAAMNIYAMYRHVEAEANSVGGEHVQFEDVDLFMTGAIIKF